ncbi:hypothetical protein E2R68_05670 [Psychromonas sp. RZ22]|uniref:hypothetical protein n=1 Tax=Psychromonas algarum TaxID=2555643 RepID=UPI00106848F6|nr:hypothetical protein [Psychromonas sp. RZ22]TEW55245.1 hypothetical protein E2R68_05670 [Psychromonas sp. RZ22]
MLRYLLFVICFVMPLKISAQPYPIKLSEAQTQVLAKLVWANEGAGRVENLTVWNKNENFPSLGIGHFIWYPTEKKGPYIEQFPALLSYLQENKVIIPAWLTTNEIAPWKTRDDFYKAFDDQQLTELRELMHNTVGLQARFIIKRLETGIPAILKASSEQEKVKITQHLADLTATPEGIFILLDYINFKGEGISDKEQYQGYGWGLKQVLLAMPDKSNNVLLSFALSADEMLTRRVKNAPRDEFNWLRGWRVRVYKYPTLKIQ